MAKKTKRANAEALTMTSRPMADGEGMWSMSLLDPSLAEYLRGGQTASGASVGRDSALRNMAVWRCIDVLTASIGMLPLYLRRGAKGKVEDATTHPLWDVLTDSPNSWQSPFDFKAYMQSRLLIDGNAYALVIRSGGRVLALIPLDPSRISWKQNVDWTITYTYNRERGGPVVYNQAEILHLRGLTKDGVDGISRLGVAQEAIGIALQAERAAARLFANGVLAGGVLSHPKTLSDGAIQRLKESLRAKSGAENAAEWLVAEEGLDMKPLPNTSRDSQHVEQRTMQIEEVARAFGVPRPLLMMDDTSWGTGIEQLAILFVRFGLAPWFRIWEEGIGRVCLTREERKAGYRADFDEQELLRGTLKDQAEFFAKALGAGGARGWMTQNEVRDVTGQGRSTDPEADSLKNPMTQPATPAKAGAPGNAAA